MDIREYICSRYTIKKGDTLYKISREYNIPVALILRLNPFVDIYNMQVGDELCIPAHGQMGNVKMVPYVVKDNESLQSVVDRFGIEVNDLMKHNNPSQIMLKPGATIMIPTYER